MEYPGAPRSMTTKISLFFCACSIMSGLLYLGAQYWEKATFADPLFVGLLMSNNVIALRVIGYLEKRVLDVQNAGFENFYLKIFDWKTGILSGLLLASVFFIASLIIKPVEDTLLNCMLAIFLGISNLLTGQGAAAMFLFVKNGFEAAKLIKVELWDRSSALFSNYLNLAESTARGVALIGCVGIINASVSLFDLGAPIYVFSSFAIGSILIVYVVPTIPIVTSLKEQKRAQLSDLSAEIQKEYDLMLDAHKKTRVFNSSNLENMLRVYKDIVSIRTFPPVGERTLNTALIVTILTVLPSLVDIAIRNLK